MLATNLLMLLASKQYLAELNILNNFILKRASVVIDIDIANNNKLSLLIFRTTTTAIH